MDITTVIAIVGLIIALVSTAVSIWAWRRRRAAADCRRLRDCLEQMRGSFGEGKGLAFKDHGAFVGSERESYEQLRSSLPFVVDRQLRDAITEIIKVYDAAEASALKFEPSKGDGLVFELAARYFEPNNPAERSSLLYEKAVRRLAILERRASGL